MPGLFGQQVEDPEPVLLNTPYSEDAMEGLSDLAYGELPTLPTLDLEGISGKESQLLDWGMGLIEKMMSGKMPEAYTLGMNKIKSVLGGEYDPTTSPYYEGLKAEAGRFEEKGKGDIRTRGQMGGMLYSEPAMGIEADFSGQIGTGLTKELGRLFESNINREASMIPQLLGYSGQKIGREGMALSGMAGLAPLAGKGGDIQRQEDILNQQIGAQQAMLPYTAQAPLLQYLSDWGNFYQPSSHYEPGFLDYALPFAGMFA
jgi:hypothetical protein